MVLHLVVTVTLTVMTDGLIRVFTEFLGPLKLLMECLHIFPKHVRKDVFEECHKQPSLPFLSK